jgi:hypothetical protein
MADEFLFAVPITNEGHLDPSVDVHVALDDDLLDVDMSGEMTKVTISIHSETAALELVKEIIDKLADMHRKNEGEDVIELELKASIVSLGSLQIEQLTRAEEKAVHERWEKRLEQERGKRRRK